MRDRLFALVALLSLVAPLALLAAMLVGVLLTARFDEAALLAPFGGTALIAALAVLAAAPIGVLSGIYLEEYAPESRLSRWLELSISTLAGVPSVVFGLAGLLVFVRALGLGVALAGALTLAGLAVPIVIVATREALRAVPVSTREAAIALGLTRVERLRHVLLPMAAPGVLSGLAASMARVVGEAAPLVVIGAIAGGALPVTIYDAVAEPGRAAAGILVLLAVVFGLIAAGTVLRRRVERWT